MVTAIFEPILIADNAALAAAAGHWLDAEVIALDTEFLRTDTFYPILGLVQVCTGPRVWLVDPLSISDLAPLAAVLASPKVVKALHSCSEDLEVFQRALGQLPVQLFDTQVASAMTGNGFSISYRTIVKNLLGVELDKQETRSDWLKRPLSDAQLRYAAEDVHYLMEVYRQLNDQLAGLERSHWLAEDAAAKLAAVDETLRPQDYYWRIKGAWRLDRRGLAILQRLAAWREEEARREDRPRSRVVADADLLEIATRKPRRSLQLSTACSLHPRAIRRYGETLADMVNQVLEEPEENYPALLAQPLPRECSALVKLLQGHVSTIAEALGVAPEILARRTDIEYLVRTFWLGEAALPSYLASGWREAAVGSSLLRFINAQEAVS